MSDTPAVSDSFRDGAVPDDARVNLEQEHDIRYWTHRWRVGEGRLREAVEEVGTSAAAVARQLGKGDPL